MDNHFWHNKWNNNQIAFHQSTANPILIQHVDRLPLAKDSRIFIPLCGKTLDIKWLLNQGYRLIGSELVEEAVKQLFSELGIEPEVSTVGTLLRYSAPNIDIFVGNIFELSGKFIGPIDAVYDRAALVALPEQMRKDYAVHLMAMTAKAPQLLISYFYDQTVVSGPPFSVSEQEVIQHYGKHYKCTLLETIDVVGGLKGKCPATEQVWLLQQH